MPIAEWMIVLAITDPERANGQRRGGISAFLDADQRRRAVRVDRAIGMWGEPGGPGGGVGARRRAGRALAAGRRPARGVPDRPPGRLPRPCLQRRARAVGLSRWAIEQAVEYTKGRQSLRQGHRRVPGRLVPLGHGRHRDPRRPPHGPQRRRAARPGATGRSRSSRWPRPTPSRRASGPSTAPSRPSAPSASPTSWASPRRTTRCRVINVADGTNEILNRTIFQRLLGGDLDL